MCRFLVGAIRGLSVGQAFLGPTVLPLASNAIDKVSSQCYAIACRYLVGAIKGLSDHTSVGQAFLGLIVLPLASNATDHMSAVIVAARNKMDLAFGCAHLLVCT